MARSVSGYVSMWFNTKFVSVPYFTALVMFFFLSKTITIILMPVYWLIILLSLYLFTKNKKRKRFFKIAFIVCFIVLTNPFLINLILLGWEYPPTKLQDLKGEYEVGIVLTGITQNRKSPKDRVHLAEGADRIMHALMLYRQGKIKQILITGGDISIFGEARKSEASALKSVLLLAKVPEADILIEEKACNTRENAVFSKTILQKKYPQKKYLLITSAFHMRRALGCFKGVGLEVMPFSAGFYTLDLQYTIGLSGILPTEKALALWQIWVHEAIGYATYSLMGYLG